MTTASVIAVAMDTLTVPCRTPKCAFARTTIESRIQTRLEKSSKTIFYAMGQQFLERERRNESIAGTSYSLSWLRRQIVGPWGAMSSGEADFCAKRLDYICPLKEQRILVAASGVAFPANQMFMNYLPAILILIARYSTTYRSKTKW